MNHSIAETILDAIVPWVLLGGILLLVPLTLFLLFTLYLTVFVPTEDSARPDKCPHCDKDTEE